MSAKRFLPRSRARGFAPALAIALVGLVAGCGSYNEQAPANCASSTGAHAVTCPGVPGCTCAAPDACCLGAIDSYQGTCGPPRTCAGLLLSCDGPEDCNGGVCCLTRSGSSCTAANACSGTWLGRNDAQCVGSGSNSCMPADFGQKGVNDRGLDGHIGLCRQ